MSVIILCGLMLGSCERTR